MDKLTASILEHPTITTILSEKDFKDVPIFNPMRKITVPDEFDGRKVWEGLITPVMNQGKCGSCWAFASASTLSDRFNIQSVGQMHVQLSPTKMILCDWEGEELTSNSDEKQSLEQQGNINLKFLKSSACFGNSLLDAWRYLYTIGIPTIECIPYDKSLGSVAEYQQLGSFRDVSELPLCSEVSGLFGDMCANYYIDYTSAQEGGTPARFYGANNFYTINGTEKTGGKEYNIRYDIYLWGPVSSAIRVYPDFYSLDSANTIYSWNGKGNQVGGHAIEIVGWGSSMNTPYWIVKNSWGINWGDGGYFKIVRGKNMCGIEENVVAGLPDFFYPPGYKYPIKLPENPATFLAQHDLATENLKSNAGGIDTTTGYTRRIKAAYPWINFSRPVDLEDLPNWKTFIAGIDSNITNRVKYRIMVLDKNIDITHGHLTSSIYLAVMIFLISLTTFIFWKSYKDILSH